MENQHTPSQTSTTSEANVITKKMYVKPQLKELGDLRSLTLGGSPGGGDSANPAITKT